MPSVTMRLCRPIGLTGILVLVHIAAADLPQSGGLTALPSLTMQSLALVNAGFEEQWNGWRPAQQEAFSIHGAGARTGAACLSLNVGAQTKWTPSLRQDLPDLRPGVYRLSFWVKTQGIAQPAQGVAGARVSIEYLLKSGERAWPSTSVFSGTSDWRPVELQVLVPVDVKDGSAAISIHRYGPATSGEALFDDFTLERLVDPPVEVFLLYPNYRGYLPAEESTRQPVRLWVKVNQADAKEPVKVEVTDEASHRTVATVTLPEAATEQVVSLDAAAWPAGIYAVRAKLGTYEYPAYMIRKLSEQDVKLFDVWFDQRNVLHLQGRPTFPLGLYNTVLNFAVVDDQEIARLDKMAEAPVNFHINYTWWPCGMKTRSHYLSEMQKRGIWYLDTVNNVFPGSIKLGEGQFPICDELLPSAGGQLDTQEKCDQYLTLLAQQMSQASGHVGWYVMDERPFDMVPAVFHQYTVLRSADPGHLTYGVSNRPNELHKWRDTLDVFGLDPYPLMNMKAGRPLSLVGEWTCQGVEATYGSRPVWMVIQFFQGWSTDRWPTEEELRSMSLMAITEGARGLFYWSFGTRGLWGVRDTETREKYWQALVRVMQELKRLEPALVAPDAPDVVTAVSDERVRWRAREADGKWFVFAYMPARTFAERETSPLTEVTFTLKDQQQVRRSFRPDTADWFEVTLKGA